MKTVFESSIPGLKLLYRGKVRDLYEIDSEHMLVVTSDRISAFDVILPTPIPGKGEILTTISSFWFSRTRDIVHNHITDIPVGEVLADPQTVRDYAGRAIVVRRLEALPIEAVVRGYLIGSGWRDYQTTGEVCGIRPPPGLRLADKLPEPLFTPATKAAVGDHDENISFGRAVELVGQETARQVRDLSLRLYAEAARYAEVRGLIIADTKFEFGLDAHGDLVLIDEVLTPDSSRFWSARDWEPGRNPASFDKQYVRDYLEGLQWDKAAPGPELPDDVVRNTVRKYNMAKDILLN